MSRLGLLGRHSQSVTALFALGFSLLLGVASPAKAEDQSPLARRFFKEAPQAWEQQLEFFLTGDGSNRGERRMRNADGKWAIQPARTYVKQYKGNMLDEFENYEAGAWKGTVRGENSQYIFRLARDSDTKPWVIVKVDKKDEKSPDLWNSRKEFCGDLAIAPYTPSLPQVVQSKGFRCISVDPEPTNGEELVRLTFSFTPEGRIRLKGGWLVLDPSHYWVIRKGEIESDLGEQRDGKAKWTVESDYREGLNRHPIPVKRAQKGKIWEKDRLISEQEFLYHSFDYRERVSIPENEFTLSAYGLPEPHWVRPKTKPWYLWLGIAGIVCLALGAGVFWLKRRRAASGL